MGFVADAGNSDRCYIPKILIGDLRRGNLEIPSHPIQKTMEDAPLVLEGETPFDAKVQFKRTDDHGLIIADRATRISV